MTLYLLRLPEKSKIIWLFTLFFTAMTAYAAVSVLEATAVWSRRFYAVHLQLVMIALALVAILQFAYHFPTTGRTNKEIAQTLDISKRTVKYHVGLVLNQLQLRNRYQLAQYAQQQGMFRPEGSQESSRNDEG
jgi:hypothetical protein